MKQKNTFNVKSLTVTAMMTAILCILAPFSIPVGDVPISLATFIVYIAAIILGTKRSLACVGLYILLGMVGIPVFSNWKAGVAVIAGPTGGYLIGYLLIVLCTGLFLQIGHKSIEIPMMITGMAVGTIGCYILGTAWLALQLSLSVKAALWAGVIPFLPGDIAKIVLAVVIATPIRKHVVRFMGDFVA